MANICNNRIILETTRKQAEIFKIAIDGGGYYPYFDTLRLIDASISRFKEPVPLGQAQCDDDIIAIVIYGGSKWSPPIEELRDFLAGSAHTTLIEMVYEESGSDICGRMTPAGIEESRHTLAARVRYGLTDVTEDHIALDEGPISVGSLASWNSKPVGLITAIHPDGESGTITAFHGIDVYVEFIQNSEDNTTGHIWCDEWNIQRFGRKEEEAGISI